MRRVDLEEDMKPPFLCRDLRWTIHYAYFLSAAMWAFQMMILTAASQQMTLTF